MRARIVGIIIGGAALFAIPAACADASARADEPTGNELAHAAYASAGQSLELAADAALPAMQDARDALAASEGRVLDDAIRVDLAAAIDETAALHADAESAEDRDDAIRIGPYPAATADGVRTAAADLLATADDLDAATAELPELVDDVESAVAAWVAEQERLAAEAAARAAAEAAAAQAAAESSWSSGPVAPATPGAYQVYVRGWGDIWSAQALIDSGGQWAIDYGVGVIDVSAHNYSDSTALELSVGDIVEFSGALGGRYVVTGEVWVPPGARSDELLRLGTPVAMQGCDWSSAWMRLVGLAPI